MQTSRGRGNRAGCVRKNSLISGQVFVVARPLDVGRQRHGTPGKRIELFIRCNDAFAVGRNLINAQCDLVDPCCRADPHFPAWLDQAFPALWAKPFEEQEFNRAIIGEPARWKNPCVV